jgi:hypothetical protein
MQLHCVEKNLKSSPKVVILAHRFFGIFKCLILRIYFFFEHYGRKYDDDERKYESGFVLSNMISVFQLKSVIKVCVVQKNVIGKSRLTN